MTTENVKYRWYETDAKVVIEIPAKNVKEDQVCARYTPDSLQVCAKLPDGGPITLKLNLHDKIDCDGCSYKVRPTKIELNLPKMQQTRWGKLEKEEPQTPLVKESKNWDKVVKENLNDKDEDSIESLFAKIFADGNDDQKRAMVKSFSESGGTVLSTNWDEVGKKRVEVKPPDGVEYKTWN